MGILEIPTKVEVAYYVTLAVIIVGVIFLAVFRGINTAARRL